MDDIVCRESTLQHCNFSQNITYNGNFAHTKFEKCDLFNAHFHNSCFDGTDFVRTNYEDSDIDLDSIVSEEAWSNSNGTLII